MNVYSPIYKDLICKQIDDLDISKIRDCYIDGFGLGEDLYKQIEGKSIKIFECPKTRYRFFYPFELAGDSIYYKKLEKRNDNYYNNDSWEFYKTFNLIKNSNEEILEIGSGNLSFLKLIKNKTSKITGLELNENAVDYGKQVGIEVYNTYIEEFCKTNKERFDMVCSFQVLEHINDVDSFINSSLASLKKGGRFVVAVPNNKAIVFKNRNLLKQYSNQNNYKLHCTTTALNIPPHHMGLWDKKSLKNLPKKYPIRVKSIHEEKLANFRVSLVRDILISKISIFLGFRLSKLILQRFFKDRLIKKYFKGDSILVEFEKTS